MVAEALAAFLRGGVVVGGGVASLVRHLRPRFFWTNGAAGCGQIEGIQARDRVSEAQPRRSVQRNAELRVHAVLVEPKHPDHLGDVPKLNFGPRGLPFLVLSEGP